jgi:hypothetical protein
MQPLYQVDFTLVKKNFEGFEKFSGKYGIIEVN